MTIPENVTITRIDAVVLEGTRPRTIGRNSHVDVHGRVASAPVVRLHTDQGVTGWGWSQATAEDAEAAQTMAAATVLAERPGTRFLMVGEGPQRRRLEREVGRLGITGAVSFAGLRRDVPEILRRASVFVRPSTLEGMSLTVLEAMATGLPVVATPVGGTPEIISHGVQGYLVPVADAAALAEALLKLLRDPAAGAEMGRRGRELVLSGHTWDIVVRRTAEVYEEVVGG